MYVTITFFEDPSFTDDVEIKKKISNPGRYSVYKAHSESQAKTYALKMFPNDEAGTFQYNKETIISNLSHPNIIKYIPASIGFKNDSEFHCILTEFAKYGELYDIVIGGLFDSEILVRTYFHQLIAGIGHMHFQGVAHLDLKLENIMIGSGFRLKIIDFDQAQRIKDKKITSGGTDGYRAPEVIDGSCTNFKAADIYSLGVILYAMTARSAPFLEVTTKNSQGEQITSLRYYPLFLKNNTAFWEMKAKQLNNPEFFSQDFKELINGMLQFDVSKRFPLIDVRNSNWFKGPVLSKEELRTEMRVKWRLFKGK